MTTSSSSADATAERPTVPIVSVKESLVSIDVSGAPVMKNEVGYIALGDRRLKAEVLRVQGDVADMQVFEETKGIRIGDRVELSGEMLSVTLGPPSVVQTSAQSTASLLPARLPENGSAGSVSPPPIASIRYSSRPPE